MKITYYITILILFLAFKSQSQNSRYDSLQCERAKIDVSEDLEKGVYKAYLNKKGEGYGNTFEKILKEEFGIDILIFQSCFHNGYLDCYTKISLPIIKEKFGEDIFEKARTKAIKIDKSGEGNRNAKYPGGDSELIKFIYCQLDNELLKEFKSRENYPLPTVTLYISEEGKAYDQKIEFCEDEKVINEIERIIKLIPKFQNATKDRKPVQAKKYFPIHFHKKWKRKTCR